MTDTTCYEEVFTSIIQSKIFETHERWKQIYATEILDDVEFISRLKQHGVSIGIGKLYDDLSLSVVFVFPDKESRLAWKLVNDETDLGYRMFALADEYSHRLLSNVHVRLYQP